jgi:hypothetical protein
MWPSYPVVSTARVSAVRERPEQAAEKWRGEMTRYLISFDDGAMDCAQEVREFAPDPAVGN